MYRLIFSLLLSRLDAERVHRASLAGLRLIGAIPGAAALLRWCLAPRDPALRVRALGLEFPGPLGLAAGFDKDAEAYEELGAFGFGHVEIGTVTDSPQPGNPRPRLFRLARDRAIINRLGFNNRGSRAAARRLAAQAPARTRTRTFGPGSRPGGRRVRRTVVGANIGRTRAVPDSEAIADYAASARRLAPYADYLVVNVSSPNTPGLRDLQAIERLRPLLTAVRDAAEQPAAAGPKNANSQVSATDQEAAAGPKDAASQVTAADQEAAVGPRRPPLLIKIAPDLADPDIDAVADLALELELDGIIATNTTTDRSGLAGDASLAKEAGGLSGAPLRRRSVEVLRRLRARTGDRLVLISVGGVESADDVWERLRAGATLVQAYTGMVYGGPLWAHRVNRALSRKLRQSPYRRIADLTAQSK